MSPQTPVSVVIPALGNTELLDANLPALFLEFERRGNIDELILVDDTGTGELVSWAETALVGKSQRLVVQGENGGFSAALEAGIAAASCELVFSMNSDVLVQPGFLDPLVRELCGPGEVFAAAPRVLLNGQPDSVESYLKSTLQGGLLTSRGVDTGALPTAVAPIPFAIGGTFLFRRADFLELGGFDRLFVPFYFEDVDLCWRAWRAGKASIFVPDSVVEHNHTGTIGSLLSPERRRAAVERGELLFNWKHLDRGDLKDHIALLYRRSVDAWLTDDRDSLIWLQLALDSLEAACAGRDSSQKHTTREVLALQGQESAPSSPSKAPKKLP